MLNKLTGLPATVSPEVIKSDPLPVQRGRIRFRVERYNPLDSYDRFT